MLPILRQHGKKILCWVRGRGRGVEARVKTEVEPRLVQILAVVAIIQMRILKAEVEKGFAESELRCELLDPKTTRNCV